MTALCALAIAVTPLTVVEATAADRPTTVAGCTKPTAKVHAPATVKQPKTVAKKLATTMTITTNCGVIKIALNPDAPQTVTNMSALARAKYFDKSFCHRLTTDGLFVLQCGDPSMQKNGSPGSWTGYKNENVPKATGINFPAGSVAMANAGAKYPNSNGSQFFLVYKDTFLPGEYTSWGRITSGLSLLIEIGKVGAYEVDPASGQAFYVNDGLPVQPVEIKTVTVR
jgi:peptidyl-prolyl cis-trans isomerase B (cyclophilin B)